jgi:peroxiredoxin
MHDVASWLIAAIVVVAILLLVPEPTSVVPRPAPDFSLAALDGATVTLSSLRGDIVILDFWASWCAPCTRTLPSLHDLASRLAGRGVVLLAVSLDRTADAAAAYADSLGLVLGSVLYGSLDEARAVRDLYGVGGIPHTFVIDREGWIRFSGLPADVTDELLTPWLGDVP